MYSNPNVASSHRNPNLDYVRVIATIFVVLLHITLNVVGQFGAIPVWQWWAAALIDVLTLSAVPLFVMVSGALLLGASNEPMQLFYSKRIQRVLPAAVFYICLYLVWSVFTGYDPNIKTYLIKTIVYGNPYTHLYFLFVIFGLYVFTPWIRKLLAVLDKKEVLYLAIVVLVITGLWQISVVWMTQSFVMSHLTSLTMFLPYLGYYMASYYIFTHDAFPGSPRWLMAIIVMVAGLIAGLEYVLLNQYGPGARGLIARDYQFPLVIILSLTLFRLLTTVKLPNSRIITTFAKASFGIFLIHQLVLDLIKTALNVTAADLVPHVIFGLLIATVAISFAITVLFSKLPMVGSMSGVEK